MTNSNISVSVIPNHPIGLNNQIFKRNFPLATSWRGNTHWMDSNIELYNLCTKNNIKIATCDLLPPDQADVVLKFDLPQTYNEILDIKQSAPNSKLILLLQESPFLPYWFNKENHNLFNLILTYNHKLIDGSRYQHVCLPIANPPTQILPRNWESRKRCVVLQSNIYSGIKASRTPFHYLKKIYFFRSKGWKFSWRDVIKTEQSLLYEHRRRFVQFFHQKYPQSIDVYGRGWEGKSDGWFYKLFPDRPYPIETSIFQGEKLDLFQKYRFVLAFENYQGDEGYISEKLFDAFYAGAVPIYLGDLQISSYVDDRCFIDARKFKSLRHLIDFIENCDKNSWQSIRKNIDQYIFSDKIKRFLPQAFAYAVINAVNYVVSL